MFDGPEPIYLQIAEHLRDQVLTGALTEGDQVMSTTQFATTYRINPATAAKAFTLLVTEDVIYKQRGVGMFVADGARERLRERRRGAFYTDRLGPVLAEAGLLGISSADLIRYIEEKELRA
ncbi:MULTISPECIES: GntR family transcriptional regulator [unclassified Pseudactinotalea]|uniref:GntR family transcriptional regulator n=1 Tax=unclassified Pseudactinotalea TaxID=2649176 RepID=UPI00128D07ED|nr:MULTISPECIES: GntR family transcriptional regulator [unclassified Pseudactinotalea]MPV50755.1 GntR family transcriptional regulator [Pseudactinotalea sp. HY160]QGH70110.1 GntR family transcriptional regulator [Pseudactinotalea sp. HY158]